MLYATGHLWYGPTAPSVKSKPGWLILDCGTDWFRLYSQWMVDHSPGRWARVVDRDRVFGNTVDKAPRLALVRPQYDSPAWGPHISICRGEKPRSRKDIWSLQESLSDAQWAVRRLDAVIAELHESLNQLSLDLVEATSDKQRARITSDQERIRKTIKARQANLRSFESKVAPLVRRSDDLKVPSEFRSGAEIEFGYDPTPKTKDGLHHWWLDILEADLLGEVRDYYGLRPRPRVPFHLTLGIESGKKG